VDTISRDLEEIHQTSRQANSLLNETAFHALNQVWNRMSIYSLTPRGRPLGAGVGFITSAYGNRPDPFSKSGGEFHSGVDFAAAMGTPIMATASGVVVSAVPVDHSGYGLHVRLHHGLGYQSLYAHCSAVLVTVGQRVKKGQVIALLGRSGRVTGQHVHYEVMFGVERPIDPMQYIQLK
jgi:murein DD-endopeptidase MepM/ murein hydrolase activator NlpD